MEVSGVSSFKQTDGAKTKQNKKKKKQAEKLGGRNETKKKFKKLKKKKAKSTQLFRTRDSTPKIILVVLFGFLLFHKIVGKMKVIVYHVAEQRQQVYELSHSQMTVSGIKLAIFDKEGSKNNEKK